MEGKRTLGWEWEGDDVLVIRNKEEFRKAVKEMPIFWRRVFLETRNYRIGGMMAKDGEFSTTIGFSAKKELPRLQKEAIRELEELGFKVCISFDSCAEGYLIELSAC